MFGLALAASACAADRAQRSPEVLAPSAQSKAATASRTARPGHKGRLETTNWFLLPELADVSLTIRQPNGDRYLISEGMRVVDAADGSLQLAPDVLPTASAKWLRLPDRLGGGFVLAGEVSGETWIWRADAWHAPLRPLARVSERVSRLFVGFDRLYIQLSESHELLAIDADDGQMLDLGALPESPAFSSVAFVDGWFGAVAADVRGVLATFDAGASWHSVQIEASLPKLEATADGVIIGSGRERRLLTAAGHLEPYRSRDADELFREFNQQTLDLSASDEASGPARAHPSGALRNRPLHSAVLYGAPMSPSSAVVANDGLLMEVSLQDGRVLRTTPNAYPSSDPCQALSLGAGIGFVCPNITGTSLYRLTEAFNLEPVIHYQQPRVVQSSGNGRWVVRGGCTADAPGGPIRIQNRRLQPYCVLDAEGKREIRVSGDLGVERVVALDDGLVVVLIPPRHGTDGQLTLIDGDRTQRVELDLEALTPEQRLTLSSATWLNSVTQVGADSFGTWVLGANRFHGVRVSLDGSVAVSKSEEGDIRRTVLSGPIAFEVTTSGVGWQSTNYGFDWHELALPRGLTPLSHEDGVRHAPRPVLGCTEVGCAYGAWLRIGFSPPPNQRTSSAEDSEPGLAEATEARSNTLRNAPQPPALKFNPVAYSSWRLTCYPTGESRGPRSAATRAVAAAANSAPRRGFYSGYTKAAFGSSSTPSDIESTANRPFLGIPSPRLERGWYGFDMGADAESQFRGYAWGASGDAWNHQSAWLVRVADRFDLDATWSTAPTRTPWPDVASAAQAFGADRTSRYSTNWSLILDPDERGGLLRINAGGSTEFHFIKQGQPISSWGNAETTHLDGVVEVGNQWYFATHEGSALQVYVSEQGQPRLWGRYPVGSASKPLLIRTTDAEQLGILLRARRGAWYIYPLGDDGHPQQPLMFPRELLNEEAGVCPDVRQGWLVQAPLPLTRSSGGSDANVLDFAGSPARTRAQAVLAKVVLDDGQLCVSELAAQLASSQAWTRAPRRERPPVADSIPLTLTDRSSDTRYGFRCVR